MRVVVRVRPVFDTKRAVSALVRDEAEGEESKTVLMLDDWAAMKVEELALAGAKRSTFVGKKFSFDRVLWALSEEGAASEDARGVEQAATYHEVGLPALRALLEGRDAAILAYGATGSGKSYSVFGSGAASAPTSPMSPSGPGGVGRLRMAGVVPRVARDVLRCLALAKGEGEREDGGGAEAWMGEKAHTVPREARFVSGGVFASLLELYNEKAYDLLGHVEAVLPVEMGGGVAAGVREVVGSERQQEGEGVGVGAPAGVAASRAAVPWRLRVAHEPAVPQELVPRTEGGMEGFGDRRGGSAAQRAAAMAQRVATPLRVVDVGKDSDEAVQVLGLSRFQCWSAEQVEDCVAEGMRARTVAATADNDRSSRGHALFLLTLERIYEHAGRSLLVTSRMIVADLAGSEAGKHWEKTRATEMRSINTSLVGLGSVIRALSSSAAGSTSAGSKSSASLTTTTSERRHVPFRTTLLTRLLRVPLAGVRGAVSIMLATVAPEASNATQTKNTLEYACMARDIRPERSAALPPARTLTAHSRLLALESQLSQLQRAEGAVTGRARPSAARGEDDEDGGSLDLEDQAAELVWSGAHGRSGSGRASFSAGSQQQQQLRAAVEAAVEAAEEQWRTRFEALQRQLEVAEEEVVRRRAAEEEARRSREGMVRECEERIRAMLAECEERIEAARRMAEASQRDWEWREKADRAEARAAEAQEALRMTQERFAFVEECKRSAEDDAMALRRQVEEFSKRIRELQPRAEEAESLRLQLEAQENGRRAAEKALEDERRQREEVEEQRRRSAERETALRRESVERGVEAESARREVEAIRVSVEVARRRVAELEREKGELQTALSEAHAAAERAILASMAATEGGRVGGGGGGGGYEERRQSSGSSRRRSPPAPLEREESANDGSSPDISPMGHAAFDGAVSPTYTTRSSVLASLEPLSRSVDELQALSASLLRRVRRSDASRARALEAHAEEPTNEVPSPEEPRSGERGQSGLFTPDSRGASDWTSPVTDRVLLAAARVPLPPSPATQGSVRRQRQDS